MAERAAGFAEVCRAPTPQIMMSITELMLAA
jgi:hypothetical protein